MELHCTNISKALLCCLHLLIHSFDKYWLSASTLHSVNMEEKKPGAEQTLPKSLLSRAQSRSHCPGFALAFTGVLGAVALTLLRNGLTHFLCLFLPAIPEFWRNLKQLLTETFYIPVLYNAKIPNDSLLKFPSHSQRAIILYSKVNNASDQCSGCVPGMV